jgi:phospholipase C
VTFRQALLLAKQIARVLRKSNGKLAIDREFARGMLARDNSRMKGFRGVSLVCFAALLFINPSFAQSHTNIQTVFIILMENVTWSNILGSASAPYINNTLLPMSSYADNMFIAPNTFGSLPQYLWLEAGTNFGINDSNDPGSHHVNTTNHFVLQLERAGLTWKAYQENINGMTCPTASSGLYAAFHNPFVYFDDIYTNSTRCSNHIRPYLELARDLTNNAVARYNFITPNLSNDMHNATGDRIRNGDNWLAAEIPKILASPAYSNNGAIFITWDEGTGNVAGPFATIVLSKWAKGGGYRMTNRMDHASTLRTMQEIFRVPFLYAASNALSLAPLFKPTIELKAPTLTSTGFVFTVTGLATNRSNFFQFSTNFIAWSNLLTNVLTTNTFRFTDTNTSTSQRFYRITESP